MKENIKETNQQSYDLCMQIIGDIDQLKENWKTVKSFRFGNTINELDLVQEQFRNLAYKHASMHGGVKQ